MYVAILLHFFLFKNELVCSVYFVYSVSSLYFLFLNDPKHQMFSAREKFSYNMRQGQILFFFIVPLLILEPIQKESIPPILFI